MLFPLLTIGVLSQLSSPVSGPVVPTPATPVPMERVTITSGLWAQRQHANAAGTLGANFTQCERTGRIENFVKAAKKDGKYEGYFFNDSDVYKAIEGACYVLEKTKDPALDALLDSVIEKIGAAQQPDGYLNAYYTLTDLSRRWTDLPNKHELYCAGHLIEAGIAHHRATGKRTLLDIAIRFADRVDATFGPPPKRNGVPGHEEIELALIKLWRETGEERYRKLAEYFIAQRGHSQQVGAASGAGDVRALYGEYCQDDKPVEDQDQVAGHAVRAMYLYCAATDLAGLTGGEKYVPALERAWDELTGTKMYVTGGIGNSSSNEGFTTEYDLPNDSAYAETCAGIGLALWGHRMALLHGEQGAKYMDVVERGLYNGVLSGVSLDGKLFNYVNPLASRGDHHRQEWFACACCPPNILRLVAQVGGMIYAQTPGSLMVNLYIANAADLELYGTGGQKVNAKVEMTTDYPWDGNVKLAFSLPEPVQLDLMLRMPGWCRSGELSVNDERVTPEMYAGYASLRRTWKDGDTVMWRLAMPIERVHAHPRVKEDRGRVALQRGPLVYCFEGADNPEVGIRTSAIPATAELRVDRLADVLGGVTVIRAKAITPDLGATGARDALYAPAATKSVTMTAIPYYAWDNRAPGEMQVWMPESIGLAERPPNPEIRATASFCSLRDSVLGMYDEVEPSSSADQGLARMTFWPHKGTTEWVQYDFTTPRRVGGVSVYWFDDRKAGGQCATPASWRVLYRDGEDWKQAAPAASCGVEPDRYNVVRFPGVTTGALRLEITLRGGDPAYSAGILEWKVAE